MRPTKRTLAKRLEKLKEQKDDEPLFGRPDPLTMEEKRELDEMFSGGMSDEQREQSRQMHEEMKGLKGRERLEYLADKRGDG